jgi:uncharacterized HAD superfamily protein
MGIICIDVDGTLTQSQCWTPEECEEAEPRYEVINRVNEAYQKHFVIIYTARRDILIPATLKWLRKYGVMFHAISNNKIPTDVGYVDDKNISIEQFLKYDSGKPEKKLTYIPGGY